MLYRIPIDRDGLLTKVYYNAERDTLSCEDHGDMNVVAIIDYRGKKIYWYRCIFCNVGGAYDMNPLDNPTREELLKLGNPANYLNSEQIPEPLVFIVENLKRDTSK
ncbi:MAG: hypothetical protein QXD03_00165 [Candidatus Anstonellales archaeon]